jgi:chromosome segregation ATPase
LPRAPWPGARALEAIPSEYRSSDVPGIFVNALSGQHFIIRHGKAYPVVRESNHAQRNAIGLKGGGDPDLEVRRRELEQRKAQIDRRLGELSGVKVLLQASIADETKRRDDAQRVVSTREIGKRLAQQWLEELKRKQQQGESDLQSTIDTQSNEVRDWDTELERARGEFDRLRQSVVRCEETFRTLTSDMEREQREKDDVERNLQRL